MGNAPKDCVVPVILPTSSAGSTTPSNTPSATPIILDATPNTTDINTPIIVTPVAHGVNLANLPGLSVSIMQVQVANGNAACNATGPSSCEIQALALAGHNVARALHHVEPLAWNDTLAAAALTWAKKAMWKHSQGSLFPFPYGENLFSTTSRISTMTDGKSIVALFIFIFYFSFSTCY